MIEEVRTTSSTGGLKGVKPERYSFIPKAPLDLLARIYGYGDAKYGDAHNYRKGYEWSKNYDALQRHLTAWWDREDTDPESGLSHLGHAAWHVFALIVFSSDPKYKQFDDRYGDDDFNLNEHKVLFHRPHITDRARELINEHAICYYTDPNGREPESYICLEHNHTSKYAITEGPNRPCQAVDPWTMPGLMNQTEGMSTTANQDRFGTSKEGVSLLPEDERPFIHPDGEKVACDYRFHLGRNGMADGYYLCKVHESKTNRHPSEGANRPCNYIDPIGGDWGNVIPPAVGKG